MKIDQENYLFQEIIEARTSWRSEILAKGIVDKRSVNESNEALEKDQDNSQQDEKDFSMQGESERSLKKILYLVDPETWNEVASDEMRLLKVKLEAAKEGGQKIPRNVWLPTVIENAEKIVAKSYEAKSVKRVTLKSARRFAFKAGLDIKTINKYLSDENNEFWTSTITGRKYKLKVTNIYGSKIYPFTDWAVCLCTKDSIPDLKKRDKIQKKILEDHSKIILCTYGNVSLFMKNC